MKFPITFLFLLLCFPQMALASSISGQITYVQPDKSHDSFDADAGWHSVNQYVKTTTPTKHKLLLMLESVDTTMPVSKDLVEVVIDDLQFVDSIIAVRAGNVLEFINRTGYDLTIQLSDKEKVLQSTKVRKNGGRAKVTISDHGEYLLNALEFGHISTKLLASEKGQFVYAGQNQNFAFNNIDQGEYRFSVYNNSWIKSKAFKIANKEKVSFKLDFAASSGNKKLKTSETARTSSLIAPVNMMIPSISDEVLKQFEDKPKVNKQKVRPAKIPQALDRKRSSNRTQSPGKKPVTNSKKSAKTKTRKPKQTKAIPKSTVPEKKKSKGNGLFKIKVLD